jgi:hypothetical protein
MRELKMRFNSETIARTQGQARGGGGVLGIADAFADASWQRALEEIHREMEAAIEMIREGMPKTTLEVRCGLGFLLACGVCGWGGVGEGGRKLGCGGLARPNPNASWTAS